MMSGNDEWIMAPGYDVPGFESAAGYSVVGYRPKGRPANMCTANGDTCRARRVHGEVLCAGHLRASRAGRKVA